MATVPEVNSDLVHQDTRVRLSEAFEEASKFKALAQQLLDKVDELEKEVSTLKSDEPDTTE